jgi:leucyl aminopeptidase (aminopeptidase T)
MMTGMLLPFHELRRAASNLASDNVGVGEDVLIVTSSDQYPEINEALVAACDAAGAGSVTDAIIAAPAEMRDYRHPAPVIAAAERADLTIVATSLRFPRAYDDLSAALFAAGRRQVLINNAPLADFGRGASLADPAELRGRTRALAGRVSAAGRVRIASANGTDLTVGVCRPCLALTGHAEADTGFGSFPSGEAMLSPEEGTAEGVFVADAFGQVVYLNGGGPQLGLLEDPIRLVFAEGRLVELDGSSAARRLRQILDDADRNVDQLGELGLGTNPHARAIGHVENKFRLGTAHIALGDNHLIGWRATDTYGGTIVSNRHIDLVSDGIEIEIDGIATDP